MDIASLQTRYHNCDIKAEVVAADLVETGGGLENVVIRPLGIFSRKFRKDVLNYSHSLSADNPDERNDDNLLFIEVSREGIYDSLPQSLFYQANLKKAEATSSKLDEFRKQRIEEAEARKFFLVFEKEFYKCRTLTELEERKSIFGMSDEFSSDLFTSVWGELKEVPAIFHKYLFQILPIAHLCRGDASLSAALLGFVLNEKVEITVSADPVMRYNTSSANELGGRYIGMDFILGNYSPSYDPVYHVKIGPIHKNKLDAYMYNGDCKKVINFLMDYYIPFDADFEIELILEKESEKLFLRDSENYCYLGFDSKI